MEPDQMILAARSGKREMLGNLLELYRNYLRLLCRAELGRRLQGKLDASDLVQDVFLEAYNKFSSFRGIEERQFVGWLKGILAAKINNLLRHYLGTQARDVQLEQELAVDWGQSSFGHGLVDSATSPSQQAIRREYGLLLSDSLDRLPEDYREVLILRHLEELTFPEVARRMGRSLDSVEKLWLRALARLRQVFAQSEA